MARYVGNITISLGPTDLTLGALSPDFSSTVPTIVDNAFSQGLISADEISIAFEPTTTANSLNGVLTWGISFFINKLSCNQLTQKVKVERIAAISLVRFRSGMFYKNSFFFPQEKRTLATDSNLFF
jgi:hypothetical protein